MHIGIDVGGTHTDAVLMDRRRVVHTVKCPTTADVTTGIMTALADLMAGAGACPAAVSVVAIGTTHFTNTVVQAQELAPVAAIRLGAPAGLGLPPMIGWPQRLRRAIAGQVHVCAGGHEYDGSALAPLDVAAVTRAAAAMAAAGITDAAVTSIFSPVNDEVERAVEAILHAENPDITVSLSHRIGRLGLLERENATILNASLRPVAQRITQAFQAALDGSSLTARLYLSQNDGTLMDADFVRRYPIATFAAGPTNSMRGAAFLTELHDCVVADIGGTTTDIGAIVGGFPRQATTEVNICGIRTNFRMPDVSSVGIGGGSLVRLGDDPDVGPQSVGYRLASDALVFGGSTLTATDIAVAAGLVDIGDAAAVATLDRRQVAVVRDLITRRVAAIADSMCTRQGMPLVLVGGGSVLVPDEVPGFDTVRRPEGFAVANAIGAAIAQVGGEVDRICTIAPDRRDAAIDDICAEAAARAVIAGAVPGTVEIVDIEELPLAYLPGNTTRIRAKAVGDLDLDPQEYPCMPT